MTRDPGGKWPEPKREPQNIEQGVMNAEGSRVFLFLIIHHSLLDIRYSCRLFRCLVSTHFPVTHSKQLENTWFSENRSGVLGLGHRELELAESRYALRGAKVALLWLTELVF